MNHSDKILKSKDRRTFIKESMLATLGATFASQLRAQAKDGPVTAEAYLRSIIYKREEVKAWLDGKAFPFARYSSEFGWLLPDAYFKDGVVDSVSLYIFSS